MATACQIYGRVEAYQRAGQAAGLHFAFVKEQQARGRHQLRHFLLSAFPELDDLPEARADALELATSFSAWDGLRSGQGLTRDQAHAAMEETAAALIERW